MNRADVRHEDLGIAAQRAADRKRWERYAYHAPVILMPTPVVDLGIEVPPPEPEPVAAEPPPVQTNLAPATIPPLSPRAKLVKVAPRPSLPELVKAEVEAALSRATAIETELMGLEATLRASRPTLRGLLELVQRVTGVAYVEIVGPRRSKYVAWPRHFAMWLIKLKRPDLSLPTIGKAFDCDHTTVMYGLGKVAERRGEAPYTQWFAHPDVIALVGEPT